MSAEIHTVTAEALLYKDVRGKQLYYIMLKGVNGDEYAINVGLKTYETCRKMQEAGERPKTESPKKAT